MLYILLWQNSLQECDSKILTEMYINVYADGYLVFRIWLQHKLYHTFFQYEIWKSIYTHIHDA
jgi:hypothetical protein